MNALHIDYLELAVTDLPGSRAFYESAFGWSFNDYGGMYAGIVGPDGKGENGGMYASETPVAPLPLIRTADLEAALAAVEKAGGTVLDPPYDYPGGRRFIFTDPSGNRLGVYQPAE
jgi:predicted enzyme related to lactoylglutathione lyase